MRAAKVLTAVVAQRSRFCLESPDMEAQKGPQALDQRSQILLKTLVERYIAEGQPVGSRALSKSSGLDFDEIRSRVLDEMTQLRTDMSDLMAAAIAAGQEALSENDSSYVISGERNLLEVEDLSSNMVRLRELFRLFDNRTNLLQLLDLSRNAHGVQIYIGGESGIASLDECTVVTAPYSVDGQVVGSVGVIGPTRMAYERVIPIVDITARLLSSALTPSS